MKKLNFASQIASNGSLSGVWSGTVKGLYGSLEKYFEIDHVNTGVFHHGILTFPLRIINRLYDDMELRKEKVLRWFCPVSDNTPVLSFDETVWNPNNKRQYIYLDLAACNIYDLQTENPEVFAVSAFERFSRRKIQARMNYQNEFFKHAAGIFTMGHWLAEDLIHRGLPKEHIHCVGGGCSIDLSLLDDNFEKNGKRILFIGKDFKRKNGPLILEAFRILHEKKKDTELHMVGFNAKGMQQDGVTFYGKRDYKDIAELYNRCDVFCMPSVFEAYGLVFIEALTFGLPCIGRNAFEMPYFIEEGKTGFLLQENNKYELASIMEQALNSYAMQEAVHARRQWYKLEYSWNTVAKRIFEVIEHDSQV